MVDTTPEGQLESSGDDAPDESGGSDDNYNPDDNKDVSEYENEATDASSQIAEESASSYEFSTGDSAKEQKRRRQKNAVKEAEEVADIFDPPEYPKMYILLYYSKINVLLIFLGIFLFLALLKKYIITILNLFCHFYQIFYI